MNWSPSVVPATAKVNESFPEVAALGHRLHLVPATDPIDLSLPAEWHRLADRWQQRRSSDAAANPIIAAYAAFYERLGLDPTETPPSVQNLIQRYLCADAPDSVPRIHPIVDAVNVAAVDSHISLGVFDTETLDGSLRLDLTDGGESFVPLGAPDPTTLPADVLVFRDGETIISQFGYRDGEKAKVTAGTENIWLLGLQVPGIGPDDVRAGIDQAIDFLQRGYDVSVTPK